MKTLRTGATHKSAWVLSTSVVAPLCSATVCYAPVKILQVLSASRGVTKAVDVSVRGSKPGKNVQLLDTEIRSLCMKSREIFLNQPVLLELEAPLKICGMWHYVRR